MIDRYGRNIDYIRVSITDRCNLRCVYCMPKEGVSSIPHSKILSYDEIERLVQIFAKLGIEKVKITGGEPLVRKNVASLIQRLKKVDGIRQVTLTTNGVALAEQMEELAKAGIDGINLSLDTLEAEVFGKITRRLELEKVMQGLKEALKYPKIPLKINCVPLGMPGQNVADLAKLALDYPVSVRYIEMMPIGLGKKFSCIREEEVLQQLKERFGSFEKCEESLGNGPGHYYTFPGFQGKIGFISAISHKFCESCNRIRLTPQGYLKSCLQYDIGVDLKTLLRSGSSEECLKEAIWETIWNKPAGHQFVQQSAEQSLAQYPTEHGETHIMSQFGG